MSLNGLKSIVYESASVVWPNETPATRELVELFDALPGLFEHQDRKERTIHDTLDKIAHFELQPSQELRRQFWWGQMRETLDDQKQAYDFYYAARLIAEDHGDQVSVLEMTLCMASALHDSLCCAEALDLYHEMLNTWEKLEPGMRRLDTEMQIRACICREEWVVGKFDAAHGNLAHTLTKASNARKVPQTPELRKEIANALWDLALALRSDSDLEDGSLGTVKQASRRMQTARDIYKDLGVPHNHLARLDIQLADIYYDIAEIHLLRNKEESASSMRDRGEDMAREAREMLVGTNDDAAPLLEQIVSLRPHIMWPKSAAPAKRAKRLSDGEIEEQLSRIERQSAALNDRFLIAKAATLRADWLMMLHEWDKARIALTFAITGFGENGKGMATRAERLMSHLPPAHAPVQQYGSADPVQHGAN